MRAVLGKPQLISFVRPRGWTVFAGRSRLLLPRKHGWWPPHAGVAFLIIVVAAASAILWIPRGPAAAIPSESTTSLAALTGPSGPIDLGDVWGRNKVEVQLPLKNVGDKAFHCEFRTSCNCMEISPSPLMLEPGEARVVHLVIQLPQPSGGDSQPFRTRVTAHVEAGARTKSWEIVGTARSVLHLDPSAIDFGTELRVKGESVRKTLIVTSAQPLKALTAESDGATLDCTVTPLGDSGRRFQVAIEPTRTLLRESRTFEMRLRLLSFSTSGAGLPTTFVDIKGTVQHDVSPERPLIFLGAQPVNERIQDTVTLSSSRGRPFVVEAITVSSPDVAVSLDNSPDSTDPAYTVTVRISQPGSMRGHVTFRVRDEVEADGPYDVTVGIIAVGMSVEQPQPQTTNSEQGRLSRNS